MQLLNSNYYNYQREPVFKNKLSVVQSEADRHVINHTILSLLHFQHSQVWERQYSAYSFACHSAGIRSASGTLCNHKFGILKLDFYKQMTAF